MTGSIMSRHPPANPYNDITGCRAVIGQRPGRTGATKHLLRELSSQPRTLTIPPSALEIIQPTEPRLFSVRAASVVPDGVLACLTVQLSKDEWASLTRIFHAIMGFLNRLCTGMKDRKSVV